MFFEPIRGLRSGPRPWNNYNFRKRLTLTTTGQGVEAEVLQCLDTAPGLRYALRLSVNEDSIWTGERFIPLQNCVHGK